ncbi:hypothetical protein [Vibrio owensii]|uniref:hypothetical protein n=1 Tax=Vibrio owensii TaxID=696485 RepID=UPI0038CD6682
MKPLGTNNAAENELTTPKSAFVPTISQCGGSTKLLKPREFSTPEETSFQRVNRLCTDKLKEQSFSEKVQLSEPKSRRTKEQINR